MSNIKSVYDQLAFGPRNVAQIRKATDLSSEQIRHAVRDLRLQGLTIVRTPKGYVILAGTARFDKRYTKKPCLAASKIVKDIFEALDQSQHSYNSIASQVGITSVTLTNWKRGRNTPRVMELEIVANLLGFSLSLTKEPAE